MKSDNPDLFLQLLQDLKKDIGKVDGSVNKVWSTTTRIKTEMEGVKEAVGEQRKDIRTLFENQNVLKSNIGIHGMEIDRLKDDTQSIKVTKKSKTSFIPSPVNNGWKSALVKRLPWLIVAILIGMGFVGWILGAYIYKGGVP